MANYYSKCRTNYFSVTDENKLEEIINSCKAEREIQLLKNEDGKYGFCCDCNLYGIGYDDDAYELLLEELQKILPTGEVIILTTIGNEKMRYLIGSCDIITKDEINFINLETVALETARNMLQNPEFKTQMDY